MASRALIYGGKGALGQALVRTFNNKSWTTVSVDLDSNSEASHSVLVPKNVSWKDQAKYVEQEISQFKDFDAILCVAGGWAGGNLQSESLIEDTELMWKVSVQTSILSAQLASKFLRPDGLLVLPGAAGASSPTPGMIAYGVAKSAVHHLVRSLAQKDSGLPDGTTVTGIMPVILDTPMNRQGMPKANFDNWTKTDEVGSKIFEWTTNVNSRPKNGSLVRIVTKNNETQYIEE
jgi:dihydropteridine reductase